MVAALLEIASQVPLPPQVANVLGSHQSPMFLLEHATPAAQPEAAAAGSQSCASFAAHVALHSDTAVLLR